MGMIVLTLTADYEEVASDTVEGEEEEVEY
jgi:hypothetical protein